MRCITMVGVLARQSQKCNSEYLPQRRQGRKDRKIIINNFFKIILSFLRNLACFAPWRESSLLIASFMSNSKCLHLTGITLVESSLSVSPCLVDPRLVLSYGAGNNKSHRFN